MSRLRPPASSRYCDPVTVCAAPRKVSLGIAEAYQPWAAAQTMI
jgi:hypothetical protein